jgi:hypothetical protein
MKYGLREVFFCVGLCLALPAASLAQTDVGTVYVAAVNSNGDLVYKWTEGKTQFFFDEAKWKPPTNIRIRNNASLKVKVYIYNLTDGTRAIAKKSWEINPGKSVSFAYERFHLKVFKPQLFDKFLAERLNVASDVFITGNENKITITSARRRFTVNNNLKEEIKVAIYNTGDIAQAIPRAQFNVKAGGQGTWAADVDTFRVKVFRPQVLDAFLVDKNDVGFNSTATISSGLWSRWETVAQKVPIVTDPTTNPAANGSSVDGYYTFIQALTMDGSIWGRAFHTKGRRWTDFMAISGFKGQLRSSPAVVSEAYLEGWDDLLHRGRGIFGIIDNGSVVVKPLFKGGFRGRVPNEDGAWTNLGGYTDTHPAAVTGGEGHKKKLWVFIRDAKTNSLWVKYRDPVTDKWSPWTSLSGGTYLKGAPAAVWGVSSDRKDRIDVFARGGDDYLQRRTWIEGKGWQNWQTITGLKLTSSPAVLDKSTCPVFSACKIKVIVFARGPDNAMYYNVLNGEAWSGWQSLGGNFRSAPVVFDPYSSM